jgi:hypothetical protein
MENLGGPRPSLRQLIRERPLWLLLLSVALFFSRPLFLGQTFFFRDLYLWSFPQRGRLVKLAAEGLPLWDPFIHGGQPFLGHVNNLALYPTSLLSFLLPRVFAFNLEIVLHFALCAAAAYLLSRVLGCAVWPSFIAGSVFAFCGFSLSLANLLNRLLALPYVALLVLFWHLYLREGRRRWFLGAATAGVLQLLAGSVEFLALSLAIAAGWALLVAPGRPGRAPWPAVRSLASLTAVIAGLGAIQVLPALELMEASPRGDPTSPMFKMTAIWSLNPKRLPELVIPGFLGPTDTLAAADFWGDRIEDEGFPLILSIYFGAPVLALAFSRRRRGGPLPPRLRVLLRLVALAAILLALGRFLLGRPLYSPFGIFRGPVKFLAALALPAALLAADGAEAHYGRWREGEGVSSRGLAAWCLTGLLVAVAVAFWTSDALAGSLVRFFFERVLDSAVRAGLAARLAHAVVFAGAATLLLRVRGAAAARFRLPLLAGVLWLDLATAGVSVNPFASRDLLTGVPPLAEAVRQRIGEGRLFRDGNPPDVVLQAPSNETVWQSRWNLATLAYYTGASFDIPVIFHIDFDGLVPRRTEYLGDLVRRLPWERRLPVLSAGGVTAIVTPRRVALPDLEPQGLIANASNVRFALYRNRAAAPRVGFVSSWEYAASEEAASQAMTRPGFDPRVHVVLEGEPAPPPGRPCAAASIDPIVRSANGSRYRITAACDGWVVFAEPNVAGWSVLLDGRRLPIRPANVAFSAVFVPSGQHEIDRHYHPGSLFAGAAVSLLAAAGIMLSALLPRRRRAPPPSSA